MAEQSPKEMRLVGYVRRQAWEEIQQRQPVRLHTGAAVYNLPYLFTEPQEDGYEWLEVEVNWRVVRTVQRTT
ncbi:MAG: hypothetical protein RRB24_03490 [Armatimonadota bacterium]|jgi:hypothetical protein|nr:hypothetical protein [Armatimonadota bacterium]MDT7971870.1 hypothetical protein [Armatimonadota bacterium]